MHNELFKIGPITIYGYGLMIALGIIAAYFCAVHLAKKTKLNPDPVINILIVGVLFGFLGSKILYYITIFDEVIKDPTILLDVANGFVVYGGIIAGIAAAAVYCKIKKLPFLGYLDCAAPAIALAQGFGRIGCFLAGCCYGVEMDSPISITFKNSAIAPNNIPLFPSQLVSSGLDFINFALLYFIARRNKRAGLVGALYLGFYSVGRFVIEFFRGDIERGSVGALSTSQFISIFTAAAGIALAIFLLKTEQKEKAEGGAAPALETGDPEAVPAPETGDPESAPEAEEKGNIAEKPENNENTENNENSEE